MIVLAKGIYLAMLLLAVPIGFLGLDILLYYALLLLLLRLGLPLLMERTGLSDLTNKREDKRWDKITAQRCLKVERTERNKNYRSRRMKDPKLPQNW